MRELRFGWEGGVWCIAFAFDPARRSILLAGGDKGSTNPRRFYKKLVATADARFDEHLAEMKKEQKNSEKS
jgi:hypothetical protein